MGIEQVAGAVHSSFALDADVALRLLVATILGSLLGLERSVAGKHAGMRTYALVALGSAVFTLAGVLASFQMAFFSGINPLQIAGSIVIGIGFIGAGLASMRIGDHVELTTASGLWVSAGVGMAAGFGFFGMAVAATVLAFLTFSVALQFENKVRRTVAVKKKSE